MNLAKLAAFLGEPYHADRQGIWKRTDAPSWASNAVRMSDESLFYALLARAAEKGLETGLSYMPHMKCWAVDLGQWSRGKPLHKGPTPLDALVKAIEELPQGEPV